jgi:hypothetical protein
VVSSVSCAVQLAHSRKRRKRSSTVQAPSQLIIRVTTRAIHPGASSAMDSVSPPTTSHDPFVAKAIVIVLSEMLRYIPPVSLSLVLAYSFSIMLGDTTLLVPLSLLVYAAAETLFWLDYHRRRAKLEREDEQFRLVPTRTERERLFRRSLEGFDRNPKEGLAAWFDRVVPDGRPVEVDDLKRGNVEEFLAGECLPKLSIQCWNRKN